MHVFNRSYWVGCLLISSLTWATVTPVTAFSAPIEEGSHVPRETSQKVEKYPHAVRTSPDSDVDEQKDVDALNEAIDKASHGEEDQALALFKELGRSDGSRSEYIQAKALQGLAYLAMNDGDYGQAAEFLEQALSKKHIPNTPYFDMQWMLIQAYSGSHDWAKVVPGLHNFSEKSGDKSVRYYNLLGEAYYHQDDWDDAIDAFEKAQESNSQEPSQADVQRMLGKAYFKAGQHQQALDIFADMVDAQPDNTRARNDWVNALFELKDYAKARKVLEKAFQQGHLESQGDYENLVRLYLTDDKGDSKENAKKAQEVLEKGREKDILNKNEAYYALLANAYERAGETGKALAAYVQAAKISDDGDAALMAAQLYSQNNAYAKAADMATEAIRKGTDQQGRAWMMIANGAIEANQRDKAIKAMQKAAEDPQTKSQAKAWLNQQRKAQQYSW